MLRRRCLWMATKHCTAVEMTIEEKHPNFTIVFALHLTDSKKVWVMEFHEKHRSQIHPLGNPKSNSQNVSPGPPQYLPAFKKSKRLSTSNILSFLTKIHNDSSRDWHFQNQSNPMNQSYYRKVASSNASRFVARLVYNHTQKPDLLIRGSSQL